MPETTSMAKQPHIPCLNPTYNTNSLVTHEIVARPIRVEHYQWNTAPVNGGVVMKHERGHQFIAHYLNEFWLWTLQGHLANAVYDDEEMGHYLGYYNNGVFIIVNDYNSELMEKYRHLYPNLQS